MQECEVKIIKVLKFKTTKTMVTYLLGKTNNDKFKGYNTYDCFYEGYSAFDKITDDFIDVPLIGNFVYKERFNNTAIKQFISVYNEDGKVIEFE